MSRMLRRGGVTVAAALTVALTVMHSYPAQAAPCPFDGNHYYSVAWSGAGTNKGTGAEMQTWANWSLDGHTSSDSPPPFSDEAVWTMNGTSLTNYSCANGAVEVGFITGEATGGGFSNGMYPYYTTNCGNCINFSPCDFFTTTNLPTNTVIWNSATSDGTNSWAYVNNKLLAEIPYGVPTPRFNYEQAEVDYHDIWMGGGSGSNIALEYQTSSNQWKDWGVINGETGHDNGSGLISPAGYGYFNQLDQPNGVVEGGYGSTQGC